MGLNVVNQPWVDSIVEFIVDYIIQQGSTVLVNWRTVARNNFQFLEFFLRNVCGMIPRNRYKCSFNFALICAKLFLFERSSHWKLIFLLLLLGLRLDSQVEASNIL